MESKTVAGSTFPTSLTKNSKKITKKRQIQYTGFSPALIHLMHFLILIITETDLLKLPFAEKMRQTFLKQRSKSSGHTTAVLRFTIICQTECFHSRHNAAGFWAYYFTNMMPKASCSGDTTSGIHSTLSIQLTPSRLQMQEMPSPQVMHLWFTPVKTVNPLTP